jgi:hypothetical protein
VAGYHLFVAVTGLVLLGTVHFAPTGVQGHSSVLSASEVKPARSFMNNPG